MAAVLALGERAVVSHRSAAALWSMLPTGRGAIEITVPGDGGREKRKAIRVHRSQTLLARHTTGHAGVPVTKPARTLRDLHRAVPQPIYQRAVRRALDLRLITNKHVGGIALTRSELERLFLRLPPSSPAPTRGQRPRRSLRGGLPMAGRAGDRRG